MVHIIRKKRREEKLDFPLGRGNDVRISIYVPTTIYDKPVSEREVKRRIEKVSKFFSKQFGGTTNVSGVGYWIDDNGNLIKENVIKVTSFVKHKNYLNQDKLVRDFVKDMKKEWKQYSVAYEFESPEKKNSTMYFV